MLKAKLPWVSQNFKDPELVIVSFFMQHKIFELKKILFPNLFSESFSFTSRVLERRAPSAGAMVGAALRKLSWSATRSGAPKKAGALVGAQLALQRSDNHIIHAKNEKIWKISRAAREFSTDRKTKYFFQHCIGNQSVSFKIIDEMGVLSTWVLRGEGQGWYSAGYILT